MNKKIFRKSPLAGVFSGPKTLVDGWHIGEAGLEGFDVGPAGVRLWDWSHRTRMVVEGDWIDPVVRHITAIENLEIGMGQPFGSDRFVYRLRHDQVYFEGPAKWESDLWAACSELAATSEPSMTVTNVTDGRFLIGIEGNSSREILSRLCGLNLSDGVFPNHAARQTQVAKIHQLVIRRDLEAAPMFLLSGGRSLAVYFWEQLLATSLRG